MFTYLLINYVIHQILNSQTLKGYSTILHVKNVQKRKNMWKAIKR